MRIKCPECSHVLSLNQPKAGSYRPKCKHCGKAFRLKVTDDDPPKVGVGKLRTEDASKESSKPKAPAPQPTQQDPPAAVDATMDRSPNVDATIDSAVEATMDNSPRVETTLDGGKVDATVASGTSATVEPATASTPSASKTVVDATMEGTATGQSAGVSVSAGGSSGGAASASAGASVSAGVSKSKKPLVSAGGSAAKSAAGPVRKASDSSEELPEKLGGYRILRLLGRGAMGAVYEAKQVSLDRLVALKTIRDRLTSNPASLARFTREAYAAAQLTHHNVVQIYDFGEDAGRHFFSMEWVRGGPLDEVIREKGALDPRLAAGYTLQAARGLLFAHRNGMVHRDIKPANLLLSDEGVVKVADLGLVKIPDQMDPESDVGASSMSGLESGTQVTMQGTAVGTPAYMAPEQGIDAAGVDHRADIYSLGCTLFFLLAGRAPFEGSVVSEVLDQHANQPLPSLVSINSRVPQPLQQVVERAMAKRPEDRYDSLSEMISDLEGFLGVSTDGKFSPTSDQADQWESIAAQYASSAPLMRLSKPILAGLIAICGLLTLVGPFLGLGWSLLGPSLFLAAVATAIVLGSGGGKSPVANRGREWIGSLSWIDYGIGLIGTIVFLLVAAIAGMLPGLIVGLILGGLAGAAYHFVVVTPARKKQQQVLVEAERFIRDLRIDGADEDGVRSFAARYAGKPWQHLFEDLFGYDSLCAVREKLRGDPSFSASTASSSWRDRVCATLASKAKANRESRDHDRLAKIEQRGLQSEGISAGEARERAWQIAAAVMDNAKAISPASSEADAAAAEAKRAQMKAMLADARSGKYKKKKDKLAPLRFALGGQTRLLAGCVLLAVFAIWGKNQGMFDLDTLKGLSSGDVNLSEVGSALRETASETDSSTAVLGTSTSAWSIGIAGLLLCMSAFISGWRMTPFALVATIVILFGPMLGVPGVGSLLQPWMLSALIGVAIYVPGVLFGESKEIS